MFKKTLTYKNLCEINGDGYNPKDNRTFKGKPLSMSPSEDLRLHMSMPQEEGIGFTLERTSLGNFYGNSSVELRNKAENNVLHFPVASNINYFIKIEVKKIATLFPASMIERYNLKDNVVCQQPTTIFYNKKIKKFVILFDERFLKDMEVQEVIPPENNANIRVFEDKKNKGIRYLGIIGDSVEDVLSNMNVKRKDSPFRILCDHYKNHFLSMEDAERVIVVRFKQKNNEEISSTITQSSIPNFSDREKVVALMTRQHMSFEFFQAAKIRDMFYLMNNEGKIDPKAIIYFKEEETCPENIRKNSDLSYFTTDNGLTFIIMAYTDENWIFINKISERLSQLNKDLENFFLSSKTEVGQLDKSFDELTLIGSTQKILGHIDD